MPTRSQAYQSYLVRMWRDGPGSPVRVSLQNVSTGEVVDFKSVAKLLQYLARQVNEPIRIESLASSDCHAGVISNIGMALPDGAVKFDKP